MYSARTVASLRSFLILAFCGLAILSPSPVASDDPGGERLPGGIVYREYTLAEGPWAIHVLDIPRPSRDVALGAALGSRQIVGLEPLDSLASRVSTPKRQAIAGINGDFFIIQRGPYQGDPIGLCVTDGELVSTPVRRSAAVILENGEPAIGRFQFKATLRRPDGQTVRIDGVNQQCPMNGIALLTPAFHDSTRAQENTVALLAGPLELPLAPKGRYRFTVRELRSAGEALAIPPKSVIILGNGAGKSFLEKMAPGDQFTCTLDVTPSPGKIHHAIGGGPRLIRNGGISIEAKEEGIAESFVATRHPRTAFGYNREHIFLVTVDGRQPGYSAGMSLTELAGFMLKLGAHEALNLDGGGSTTMWVRGAVKNMPSDGRVRPIANAMIVFGK
jgi:hypothetical protein